MNAKINIMEAKELINIDPEIMSGVPVFRGTRVPIRTLFDYIANGYTLEEFLDSFPSVTLEAARGVLALSERSIVRAAAA